MNEVCCIVMSKPGVFPWHPQNPEWYGILRARPAGPGDTFQFEVVQNPDEWSIPHEYSGRLVELNGNSALLVGFFPLPQEES